MIKNSFDIDQILSDYLLEFPEEQSLLKLLLEQIRAKEVLTTRKNFTGHLAASAFIVDSNREKILLIQHNILRRLLQPGGHVEIEDINTLNAAYREVREEVGIQSEYLQNISLTQNQIVPFDIDTHPIRENTNKHEAQHFHHDFRYLFILDEKMTNIKLQEEEVSNFKWVSLKDFELDFKKVAKKIDKLLRINQQIKFN